MKTFAAVFIISCAVVLVQSGSITPEMKAQFIVMAEECQTKTGASANDLATLMNHSAAVTKEGKCLSACIMQKMNSLDSNGKLDKAGSMAVAMIITKNDPAEMKIAEEVIDACVGLKVSDDA